MNLSENQREMLVRYFDGRLTQREHALFSELLRTEPEARAYLRDVAEQSVMIADLERMTLGRQQELSPRPSRPYRVPIVSARWRFMRWAASGAIALFALLFLASAALHRFAPEKPWIVRIARATGVSQIFGSNGELKTNLEPGTQLSFGDTLETRSCDGWIELDMRDGSKMTIGGHSTLRILDGETGKIRFNLANGNLWVSPAQHSRAKSIAIQTPTVIIEARDAQFDLKITATDSMLRVNKGSAHAIQILDGSQIDVLAGYQLIASLANKAPLSSQQQPKPVNRWSSNIGRHPEVLVGKWIPADSLEQIRLAATPLLWPIPNRDPLLLYAASLSVARSSDRPVLLEQGAYLLFRGRTIRTMTVRFGFSTQIMQGVFSGKFEIDVRPDSLGSAGKTWEIKLPLSDFRAMHPQLSVSPKGLELTDVYALTVNEDAGLEINQIELIPLR